MSKEIEIAVGLLAIILGVSVGLHFGAGVFGQIQ